MRGIRQISAGPWLPTGVVSSDWRACLMISATTGRMMSSVNLYLLPWWSSFAMVISVVPMTPAPTAFDPTPVESPNSAAWRSLSASCARMTIAPRARSPGASPSLRIRTSANRFLVVHLPMLFLMFLSSNPAISVGRERAQPGATLDGLAVPYSEARRALPCPNLDVTADAT